MIIIKKILYVKEASDLDDVFKENSQLPIFIKKVLYFIKKIFLIGTIKDGNIYIIPCTNLKNRLYIKKILKKLIFYNSRLVFSKKILENEIFMQELEKVTNRSAGEGIISYCLIDKILDYIASCAQVDLRTQEVVVAINDMNETKRKMILNIVPLCKRISIVTTKRYTKIQKNRK